MHRLVCRTKFNMFLPDKPCREVGLAESQFMNGELLKSTLIVIFRFKRTPAKNGSWYLEEGNTTDLEDYRKVTNILRELANTINMN